VNEAQETQLEGHVAIEVVSAPDGAERPRREPLTSDRIVQSALRIMDEEGLDAVTMRRVGRDLGCEAMSLYNHVRDKEDLLDGMAQAVLRELQLTRTDDWAASVRLAAGEFRRVLLAHPSVMTLLTERKKPFTTIDSLRIHEFMFELFDEAGLSPVDTAQAFHAFGGYVLGAVALELGLMVGGPNDEELEQTRLDVVRLVEAANLVRVREVMPWMMDCDLDAQFDFGLDLLIEGLRARARRSD
jgi:AcrR family transcriptional regulator